MAERKCSSCGTWSAEDYCPNCNALLNPLEIQKIKLQEKEEEILNTPKPKLDQFFINWKATKNPIFKFFYYIAYSFWMVYMAILSFILMVIAWGPG